MAGTAAAGYKENEQFGARIEKIRYSHDAMIDYIIANPRARQNDIALAFGYTVPWVSRVIGSDAFQSRLAERRKELVDPVIVQSVEERLRGLAVQATEVIADNLAVTRDPDLAVKALEISAKALGFGARERGPAINNSFVVQLPTIAPSAEAWAAQHAPAPSPGPQIIDAEVVPPKESDND
jgi:hypothetical protein